MLPFFKHANKFNDYFFHSLSLYINIAPPESQTMYYYNELYALFLSQTDNFLKNYIDKALNANVNE